MSRYTYSCYGPELLTNRSHTGLSQLEDIGLAWFLVKDTVNVLTSKRRTINV